MTRAAICTQGLAKRYGEAHAVAGRDLEIPSGELFGLLGPNGASKTTTVQMLATLIPDRPPTPRRSPGSTSAASQSAYAERSAWCSRSPPSIAR